MHQKGWEIKTILGSKKTWQSGQKLKQMQRKKEKKLKYELGLFKEMISFLGPDILAQNGVLGTVGSLFCFVFPLHVIMSSFIFKWSQVADLNLFHIKSYFKITFNRKK